MHFAKTAAVTSFVVALGAAGLVGAAPADADAVHPPIDPDDIAECFQPYPDSLGISGVTDEGDTIALDVVVLADDQLEDNHLVDTDRATAVADRAGDAYSPLGITVSVSVEEVDFSTAGGPTTDAEELLDAARDHFGGERPAGADLVYVLTDVDLEAADTSEVAGLADCIGGVQFDDRAFAVGEDSGPDAVSFGPFTLFLESAPVIAAHEIGHLMGGHHHYANCAEGTLGALDGDLAPCSLMFNAVDTSNLWFSTVNGAVVRGHADAYARP